MKSIHYHTISQKTHHTYASIETNESIFSNVTSRMSNASSFPTFRKTAIGLLNPFVSECSSSVLDDTFRFNTSCIPIFCKMDTNCSGWIRIP